MIYAEHLSKTFKVYTNKGGFLGSVRSLFSRDHKVIRAVDDISLRIREGEFVGYIGPNGAGKSTTIKMLTGILHPTEGKLQVAGFSPQQQRKEMVRNGKTAWYCVWSTHAALVGLAGQGFV